MSDLSLTDNEIEMIAQLLGMKRREIRSVEDAGEEYDGSIIVTTHDGQRTLVHADGTTEPYDADATPTPAPQLHPAGPAPQLVPGELVPGTTTGDINTDGELVGDGGQADELDGKTPPAPAVTAAPIDPDAVPAGNASVVLDWVGDDVDRARRALAAEQQASKPRGTVVAALEKVIASADDQ